MSYFYVMNAKLATYEKSTGDVLQDWDAGKDFLDLESRRYFSKRDYNYLVQDGVLGIHVGWGQQNYTYISLDYLSEAK